MTDATILDMCCGSRMFWLDKQDERAVFSDIWGNQCDGPAVQLHPGYVLDIAGMAKSLKNAPLSPSDNQGRERAA